MLVDAGPVKELCNAVYFSLIHLLLKDDDCIVKIASLDQSHVMKRLKLMKKDKCPAGGYLLFKILN
jgi:hypothetical protein